MSKLSKREKWAKETGLKKEQYRQRKNLPFPVKNKEISVGDRPKGVSKREFWASKTGFTKEQYKQRASLPAIKPQPRRYGGGGALPSTSSGSPLVKYLSKFAKTAGEQIATGVKEVMGDASTSLRKKTEGYTPRELIKMRRDWRRSEEPIKKEQIGNITSEIKRIRQEKVVRQHQVIQKTQEQIQRERDDPIVKFGRFINEVQTDPIGTVKRVWSGEYDRPQVRPAPAYSPGKYERDQYTEAPRVDFRKSILGKYLGGAASEIINAPLQTATDIYNRAMKAKKAKESGSRLDFAIAEGRLGLAEINTIFTPISMLFNSAKELGMPEEFKMVNPIYKLAQEKITKMNLPPDLDKATRYVAGLMINPLDPKNMAEMAEMPIQLSGQAGAYVSNKALDVLPISPVNKEKLRPLFNEAGALIAQIGLFEAGIRGAKRATRPPEVRTTPKIPMADVTKGREKEVVLRPELMREGVKMEEIKRVPIKEAPKPEVKPKSVEEIVRESGMAKITKKERVTTPLGREAAGKARFDFKTNTGEVVFTPGQTEFSKAHEFGHVVNYVLGEGEKLSNRLNEALAGKPEATKAIRAIARATGLEKKPDLEITKLIKQQIRDTAKIDKAVDYKFSNPSEEFAHAVASALVNEQRARAIAPEWTKYIREKIVREKVVKMEKPTKAEIEFAKEPKAIEAPRPKAKPEQKIYTKPTEQKVVVLPESEAQKAGRMALLEKAKRIKTGLKKEARVKIKRAKTTEEVYKKTVEAEAKEEYRIERRGELIDEGLKKAIQTSEHFRKERNVRDAWRDGVVYVKNGEYRIAMTDGQKADLKMRGYRRYAGVDEIAKEKGYEDAYKYLEEVVDELNDRGEEFISADKIAYDYLMKTDPYFQKATDAIEKLEDKINELKQPYEATTTVAVERKAPEIEKVEERQDRGVEKEKPAESAREYLQRKSKQIRFRERTARGGNLQKEYTRLREHLWRLDERGAGFFAKRATVKALRAVENEMRSRRLGGEKYRLKPEMAKEGIEAFRLKDDFETITGIKLSDKQEAEIRQLNNRIFGDENVQIVSQILAPEGQKALASYKDGMIKILDGQADPKASLYHDAVHRYLEQFTTLDEQARLLELSKEKNKARDFAESEEKLAENIIEYAKSREGLVGEFKALVDRIILRIKRYFGNEDVIKEFYNEIILGKKRAAKEVLTEAVKKIRPTKLAVPSWKGAEMPVTYREPTTTPIRLDKLNTTEAVKDTIAKIAIADQKRTGFQRRGRMTMEEIRELGDLTNMNAKDVMSAKAGSIVNAENAYAVRKLMVTVASELTDFVKSLPKEISEGRRKEFKMKLNAFRKIQMTLTGIRTETGRALRQFRDDVLPEEYDVLDDLITEVKKIDATEASTIVKARKVAKLVKPEGLYRLAVRALVSARTAWMLYKPTTQIANLLGGVWKAGTTPITRRIAEVVSKEGGIAKGEARAFTGGMQDAFGEAWNTLKSDLKDTVLIRRPDLDIVKTQEIPRTKDIQIFLERIRVPEKVADKVDSAIITSYKFLSAVDKYFKTILGAGELYSQALRKATNEGLRREAFQRRIADLITDPAKDKEFLDAVNKETLVYLFQEKTALTNKVNSFIREYPEGKIVSPFVMTPANIALDAIRTSPAGFFRPLYKSQKFGERMNNAERALAYGQATLGSALAMTAMYLVAKNKITLVPPRGSGKEEFYAEKQAYSIKIGNKLVQFRRVDPLASIIVNAANAYNILVKGRAGLGEKTLSLATMFARNIMDQTFMSGVSDLFDALSNINVDENGNVQLGKPAERLLTQLGISIIPFQSALSGITAITDATLREKEGFGASVRSILPGYSRGLPATIDIFGNAVVDERGALARFFSPFKTKEIPSDKTLEELKKSGYDLSTIQLEKVGNYKLNGKAKEVWFRIIGKESKRRLDALIKTDEYKNLDQQGKDDLLRKTITNMRGDYRDKLKKELVGSSQANQMEALKKAFPKEMEMISQGKDPMSETEIPEVKPVIHRETAQGEDVKWKMEHPNKTRREFKDQYEAIDHWKPYIDAAADDAKVPRYLMYALMSIESGGDPRAQNKRSTAGGMFQFIDSTWRYVTKKYGGEELPLEKKYDPEVNAHYAALYLKELVGKTHSYKKALAAYGEGSAYAEKVLVKQTEIKNYYREKKKKEGQSSVISQYVETGSPEIDKAIANKQLKSFVKMMTYGDIPYAKIYEEDIDKALYDFMEQEFPLTDEAKKAIRDKMVMNVTGLYDPERGGFYDEALKENPYAQRSEGGLYGFTTIQNQPNVLTAMHEALHSYIMEKGNIRSEKWVDEFNKAWEQAKKNPDLKKTMDSIDYTLKTNPRYKYTTKKDKDRKANERFAYLGSELGGGGLNMLPKELREYYSDVFKPTRTTKQIKLADRLGKQYDKIIDQVADEKISREEASRKLNKIDRRLSYYFKDFQKRESYAGILKKYISK